jgi:hypothetical protein
MVINSRQVLAIYLQMIITRVSDLVTVATNQSGFANPLCSPDTVVSGGGGEYFASAPVILTTPNGLGGWQAAVLNYGPTDANLRTFAVCLGLSS